MEFTEYPNITMPSDTGLGFRGRPVFEPVIVPELVFTRRSTPSGYRFGWTQANWICEWKTILWFYILSRMEFLYAGVYETTGDLIQVYATLQESVDNQITTRASAILRQGSDVTSNDPRLNIPNTPDNLI